MNIYYHKKQNIDIPKFWIEIGKMSVTPIVLGIVTYITLVYIELNTPFRLALGIGLFSAFYIPSFWMISMNNYERDLLYKPLQKVKGKVFALIGK